MVLLLLLLLLLHVLRVLFPQSFMRWGNLGFIGPVSLRISDVTLSKALDPPHRTRDSGRVRVTFPWEQGIDEVMVDLARPESASYMHVCKNRIEPSLFFCRMKINSTLRLAILQQSHRTGVQHLPTPAPSLKGSVLEGQSTSASKNSPPLPFPPPPTHTCLILQLVRETAAATAVRNRRARAVNAVAALLRRRRRDLLWVAFRALVSAARMAEARERREYGARVLAARERRASKALLLTRCWGAWKAFTAASRSTKR